MTYRELHTAKRPETLFPLVVDYLGRAPTRDEFRRFTNSVCGPFHIEADLFAKCDNSDENIEAASARRETL